MVTLPYFFLDYPPMLVQAKEYALPLFYFHFDPSGVSSLVNNMFIYLFIFSLLNTEWRREGSTLTADPHMERGKYSFSCFLESGVRITDY